MRRPMTITAAILAATSLAGGALVAAPAAEPIRAGELALLLARAAGVVSAASSNERLAAERLAARGVVFGDRLDAVVSQADLILAARTLGAPAVSAKPGDPITPAQTAAFIATVRGTAGASQQGPTLNGTTKQGDINASCRGRAARASRRGTPASPANPNATAPPCDDEEPQP